MTRGTHALISPNAGSFAFTPLGPEDLPAPFPFGLPRKPPPPSDEKTLLLLFFPAATESFSFPFELPWYSGSTSKTTISFSPTTTKPPSGSGMRILAPRSEM